MLGVLAAEEFVGLGNQSGAYLRADQGVELGEQVEHAVGLFGDRGAAPASLALATLLEFLFAGPLVDVFLQCAPEPVLRFLLGGFE